MSAIFAPLLLLWGANVTVRGQTDCPSPVQVETALQALPPVFDPASANVLDLANDNDAVVARLISAAGLPLGEKRLPRGAPCEDMAAAIALSVATWQSDVHTTYTPRLLDWAAPKPPETTVRAWSVGVGVGAGGSVDPTAGGLQALVVGLRQLTSAGSVRFAVAGELHKQMSLGVANVQWRRTALALGWQQRILGANGLSLFTDVQLAWLQINGEGFVTNRSDATLDPGFELGVRAELLSTRVPLWAELGASMWPRGHKVMTPADMPVRALPVVEAFLRVGVALRL